MGRVAVGIEYNGAGFHGWQAQSHCRAVQPEVEAALSSVAGHSVALTIAGRTDAGVHARAQVAHFDSDAVRSERAWLLGTNSGLPPDISLRWARSVPDHFHARYSAIARTYRYLILNRPTRSALAAGRCHVVFAPLDAAPMQAAASLLEGQHDFSAFRAAECQARSPVRRLESLTVQRDGDWLRVQVRANAFLHHMVRNIVGLLLVVGRGAAPPGRAREQLDSRDRRSGAPTAPADGLYFWQAHYPPQFGLPDDSAIISAPELPAG
ncbi:MAG: tRNA pseudouridine(38-40) synthase TruA [Pseudomonadota bacterium]